MSILTCNGLYKGDKWDDEFIHPVDEDPDSFIEYNADGTINTDNPRVEKTVEILNLNNKKLVGWRKVVWMQAINLTREDPSNIECLESFPTLIAYLKRVELSKIFADT